MSATTAIKAKLAEQKIEYIKVGVFDIDGILRGKYLHKEKFLSAVESGLGFCNVVLGWDSDDKLYDNSTYTGWHTAYPDAHVDLLPDTLRSLPMEDNSVLMLGQFSGDAAAMCPRNVLSRVIARAQSMGYVAKAACEFEFFLFEETPRSVRDKNYQQLNTLTEGMFGYSVLRNSVNAEMYHQLLDLCRQMNFPIEGLHTETGPGVLEAALVHTDALEAADRGALFKTFCKVWAQRRGLMATFMAKWSDQYPGQSGHIHLSLENQAGENVFFDASKENHISDAQRWFLGGQQQLMPELLAMVANTVNSYSRMVPGLWAPLDASWGVENRTCALRVIPGNEKTQRIEYRIAAADMNPYLAIAAALASGLWGIEHRIEPSLPTMGNAYEQSFNASFSLPKTLSEAAQRLQCSSMAKAYFGEAFVAHYVQTRFWEEQEFRKAITDWELRRYFEII